MSERILGPTGSKRRKRFLLVPILLVACTALFLIGSAQAVHDLEFQLDGNAMANVCGTTPDGGPSGANACTVQTYDWDSIFNADTTVKSLVNDSNTTGFTTAAFKRDFGLKVSNADNCSLTSTDATKPFCTADTTTFATGSKDIQNISGGGADQSGNWQCNKDNNVNSKIDIMNAYSAAYTAGNGDKILYFALEKNKDNGNNNAGFWFLQGDANCASTGSAVNFTGDHRNGDILVTSAFTSGGGVSSILVFRWAGGANGCIDSNPSAAPACDQQPIGSGGDCKVAPTTPPPAPVDTICATTNSGTLPTNENITVPWLTADATLGVGNTVVPPDFFEGAIDLTKAFAAVGSTAPSCFNTFIADTRSSQTPTATLFDYARGVLGQCKTTLRTKAGDTLNGGTASPTSIGTGSVSSGSDTSTLTVTGTANWGGTLTWYLCGPVSTDGCDNTKGVQVTSRSVNQSSPAADFVSGTATLTSAGRYCWTAHFAPNQASIDAGVSAADDNGVNECFTVAKVTPALDTQAVIPNPNPPPDYIAVPAGYKTPFGSPVYDTGTLSGAATEPGSNGGNTNYPTINATDLSYAGTITFTLKGPDGATADCTTNATGTGTNPQTVNVDTTTGNKTYGPVSFTPNKAGTFHWIAVYTNTGSANNTSPVSHNSSCNDTDEDVTVEQVATNIKTKQSWFPNDTATVSAATGNLGDSGTVDFFLYDNGTCSGTALYSQRVTLGTGLGTSAEVSTSNYTGSTGVKPGGGTVTPFSIATAYADPADSVKGPYSWKVVYTPAAADTLHTGKQSACDAEHHSITYTNDPGPGTALP